MEARSQCNRQARSQCKRQADTGGPNTDTNDNYSRHWHGLNTKVRSVALCHCRTAPIDAHDWMPVRQDTTYFKAVVADATRNEPSSS